jgi:hypothetical protein
MIPPPSLYLTISLSIILCCIHLPVLTSSSSLSYYLSIYLLFFVVYIYLYLPPPPLYYLSISLSLYCSMLYTSICSYLPLLSIYLMLYTSICTYLLSNYLSIYLSIVLCCIHLPVATTSSSSLSNYHSIYL